MLRAVVALCRARGVACWLSLETEMACGIGICRGCSVAHPAGGFRCTCLDGAVFEASEVVL
jgi:NAD(P)H-flavin reductase